MRIQFQNDMATLSSAQDRFARPRSLPEFRCNVHLICDPVQTGWPEIRMSGISRQAHGAREPRNSRFCLFIPEDDGCQDKNFRSEEHTPELQSLMRISYAVFCLTKKTNNNS